MIEKSSIQFLSDLEDNNYRPWFQENKERYEAAYQNGKDFLSALKDKMGEHDVIEKTKLFRIYRDVRFSKDKTPYNTDLRMSLSREGASRRGGYYVRISATESFIACGFWNPESKDLKLIRDHIAADSAPFRKIFSAPLFKDTFGTIEGEKVKSAPKGFSKEHPAIDLLRHKQFIVHKRYKNSEVTKKDFIDKISLDYQAIRPFFDHMSYLLTHDLNGVSMI